MPVEASATSVVVSTYTDERWEDLQACLGSLERQTLPPREVIVVVDHNPALLERAREAFPGTKVIPNERPRGLAGARNSGTALADGEIVAFIDDDARAEAKWLAELEGAISGSEVVGAGGALVPLWQAPEPAWFPTEFYWVFGCSYTGLPRDKAPIRNPIGANMAVRKAVLAEVGGFREGAARELRARGVVRAAGNIPDDTDLAIRISRAIPAAVWMYQPAARVRHAVTAERVSLGYFVRRCYEEGVGKANLSRLLGSGRGLSSERRQLAVVLPRALVRNLGDLLRGRPAGALKIGATFLGILSTAAGFATASLRGALRPDRTGPGE
jgi:glucosyl-dolichyl phosphate glucuronosyltransferase